MLDKCLKDLEYWKNNCEEDYLHTPISVLRYITELEQALSLRDVVGQSEPLVCSCDNPTEYTDANNHTYCKWCGKDFKAK